ncbi:hypothetical protein [Paraburkholderia fungorum]|uniref:hypothetical protein n=1 Tax=Paraburkholderia fungorum TaxID=134537 RepID=UPI0038B78EE8
MRKPGVFIAALLISTVAHASAEWVELWKHNKGQPVFEVKLSTFEAFDNIAHSKTVRILTRTTSPKGRITFEQFSITDLECAQGYGTLRGDYMDGSPTESDAYVKNGGNGNAIIGDLLCELGTEKVSETKEGN